MKGIEKRIESTCFVVRTPLNSLNSHRVKERGDQMCQPPLAQFYGQVAVSAQLGFTIRNELSEEERLMAEEGGEI